ncbi:MAG: hypothetical protein J1E60_08025 [Christensenellaceae bacterium]|nr:hypothetical protein [Christensenellaceae bacterium]
MVTEREKQNLEELLRLIQENPDLPVVPMVDNDIVAGDEYCRWRGSFGEVKIREYAVDDYYYGISAVRFKDECGAEDALISEVLWTRAIIVNIDLPESVGGKQQCTPVTIRSLRFHREQP